MNILIELPFFIGCLVGFFIDWGIRGVLDKYRAWRDNKIAKGKYRG